MVQARRNRGCPKKRPIELMGLGGGLVAAATAGACIGFLPLNFHPAKLFMGDAGALLVGLLMAASAILVTGQVNPEVVDRPDVYTAYFQFIIPESVGAWFLHMLLVGGSMVALAVSVERHRQRGKSIDAPPADPL